MLAYQMNERASIILGCDDPMLLGKILSLLRSNVEADLLIANRVSDLLSISASIPPSLFILNFQNNLVAINSLNAQSNKLNTPILCLNKSFEENSLQYADHNIVFSESESLINQASSFQMKVRSILMLATRPYKVNTGIPSGRLADQHVENSKNLSRYVMELEQNNQTLSKIKKRMNELSLKVDDKMRRELLSIVNSIKISTSNHKHWEDFKIYFENVNPKFLEALSRRHPCLTPKDLKYCCYLKMNMSNEDIKHLLSINSESVRTHKYRLKKKMALPKDQDLLQYVQSFVIEKGTATYQNSTTNSFY